MNEFIQTQKMTWKVKLVVIWCWICVLGSGSLAKNLFHQSKALIANVIPDDFQISRTGKNGNEATVKLKSQDLTFINFHSSSCSHCISHAPLWIEFAKAMKISGATIAALDCDDFRDICSALKVDGTPAIKVFRKGELIKDEVGEELDELFRVASNELGLVLMVSGQKAIEAEQKMKRRIAGKDSFPPESTRKMNEVENVGAIENSKHAKSGISNVRHEPLGASFRGGGDSVVQKLTSSDMLPKEKILNDISLAVRYGLEKGVFLGKFVLSKQESEALLNWLDLLRRAYPSSAGRWQLDWLYSRVKDLTAKDPLSSKVFDELLTGWGFARRFDQEWRWLFCGPNSRKEGAGAGYTCGLWLLFHTLSVSVARSPHLRDVDISTAIHGFVKHFFSCNECRENFLKHNPRPFKSEVSGDTFAFVMFLWREHNFVSNRLNHEDAMDGIKRVPREMFPPLEMCTTCRVVKGSGQWQFDESVVVRYLDHAFSGFPDIEELPFTSGTGGAEDDLGINDGILSRVFLPSSPVRQFTRMVVVSALLVGAFLWLNKRRKRLMRLMKRTKH